MNICVCGVQVPFMSGGVELHYENLAEALRQAGHTVDVVRLPSTWDKTRIFDAAMAWRLVPVDADMVIALNFPSFYVRHPNKVVWLAHQHRAAYDGAGSAWSDFGDDEASLEAQRLLTEWDTAVLSEAKRLFATSGVVAGRLARFNGLSATPLYHPEPLAERLSEGPFGNYLFCPTRLETNKRPELMVEALPYLDHQLSVRIAGKGSLHDSLVVKANDLGESRRLAMLGFISDEQLIEEYAGALGVIYTPHDEDYGYVTLQAFRAGKPVITASDSGGVLEWVEDGVNGFVTDGSPSAIAEAANQLASDRELAKRMGQAGKEKIASLRWENVVAALLGDQ